jgi:hypothetical protein
MEETKELAGFKTHASSFSEALIVNGFPQN